MRSVAQKTGRASAIALVALLLVLLVVHVATAQRGAAVAAAVAAGKRPAAPGGSPTTSAVSLTDRVSTARSGAPCADDRPGAHTRSAGARARGACIRGGRA